MANEELEKAIEIGKTVYLSTFLEYVSYQMDKGDAEEAQRKFDEQRMKAKQK